MFHWFFFSVNDDNKHILYLVGAQLPLTENFRGTRFLTLNWRETQLPLSSLVTDKLLDNRCSHNNMLVWIKDFFYCALLNKQYKMIHIIYTDSTITSMRVQDKYCIYPFKNTMHHLKMTKWNKLNLEAFYPGP